jgi:hypothetical protein
MKPNVLAVITTVSSCVFPAFGADATSPIDYRQRNEPFAPADTIAPQKETPATNRSVQEKRLEKPTVDRKVSPLQGAASAIDVRETQPKNVREKDSHRPEKLEPPTSALNHRPAAIATQTDTTRPPTVAKYQDSLAAASATNMARFPAMDRATTAKINRFVFRKNPSDPSAPVKGSLVIPAAGGSGLK